MDLRALRYFVAIAQLGGITRAAASLNIAQPALSRQIRKLEQEMGVALLLRRARGVELTQAGALLLARAEGVFQQLRETEAALRATAPGPAGEVTLGLPPATGMLLTPPLMRRFQAEFPGARLRLREGVGSSLVEWVMDERLDLAVVHNPPRLPELLFEPLSTERVVLVLPPAGLSPDPLAAWRLAGLPSVSLRDLRRVPLILPSYPHTNRLLLDNATARGGETLQPAMEVDSVSMTKALIGAGMGASVLTYAAVHQDVTAGRLRCLPISRPALLSTLALARRRAGAAPPLLEALGRLIREVLAEIVAQGTYQIAEP